MVNFGGHPFLELLLRQLSWSNFKQVILAVGYKGEVIQAHFAEQAFGLGLAYSFESSPLGTGGALRNAAGMVGSDLVLVMNGDSYTESNLRQNVARHVESGAEVSVVLVPVDGREDCGTVDLDSKGHIVEFLEKLDSPKAPYLNAGIYILSRGMLCEIPDGHISLERELFPRWIRERRNIRGIICQGKCVDIGTPERYWNAQKLLGNTELERCDLERG
jgi:D-glycero-alpha-D-manno-heptose 1-phosphate guanylyltransferase